MSQQHTEHPPLIPGTVFHCKTRLCFEKVSVINLLTAVLFFYNASFLYYLRGYHPFLSLTKPVRRMNSDWGKYWDMSQNTKWELVSKTMVNRSDPFKSSYSCLSSTAVIYCHGGSGEQRPLFTIHLVGNSSHQKLSNASIEWRWILF